MIEVSVIVPVYNVEPYLDRCLKTLVCQTLENIEIIIVNDASPDNSYIIMEDYKKRFPDKIKLIYLDENVKQGGARNRALDIAQGEYICFVDSDDWTDTTMCQKLYSKAKENDSDIVYCDYYRVNEKNKREIYISEVFDWQMGKLDTGKRKTLMFTDAHPWAKIIKRKLVTDNNIYFPEKLLYEDLATTVFFVMYADTVDKLNEPLYYYNERQDSVTRKHNDSKHFMRAESMLVFYNRFKDRSLDKAYYDEFEMVFIREFYLNSLKADCTLFYSYPVGHMEYLSNMVKKLFPKYKDNPYIVKMSEPYWLKIAEINDISSSNLAGILTDNSIDIKDYHYYNYYNEGSGVIKEIFNYAQKNNYNIAVWGAGQKGQDFLEVYDNTHRYINYVIDVDSKIIGKRLKTGHIISSYDDVKEKIQIVIVINKNYAQGIYNRVKDFNKNCIVVNLDNYIMFGEILNKNGVI